MQNRTVRPNMAIATVAFILLFGLLLAGARALQAQTAGIWIAPNSGGEPLFGQAQEPKAAESQNLPSKPTRLPGQPILTPTPDAPRQLPPLRQDAKQYTVQPGDTLGNIARQFSVGVDQLVAANELTNPNLLEVGKVLKVPAPIPAPPGPAFKIIPDSELVNGPGAVGFNIAEFVQGLGGYLATYSEQVDGQPYSGAQVVQRVAQDYSVNPRLLLAVLEYQSKWVTKKNPPPSTADYPIGVRDARRKGLYRQLAWAADNLNLGFYLWRVNGVGAWVLGDDAVVPIDATLNAGTAAIQQMFAPLEDQAGWRKAVSPEGVFAAYNQLFGYPFDRAFEPLLPAGLQQPVLQLPFEDSQDWAFTGGPHGGWGDGSAWAALDFAPPGPALGCVKNDAWVVAMADGLIVRTGNGAVVEDLDGDGNEQTGWTILYMHLETRDRVQPGTQVKAGQRLGHPSCEGGVSTGTHTHLARRYNGEWIAADQEIPFVMDGWVSHGDGYVYNGTLQRDGQVIEAYAGRADNNGIQR